MHLLLLASSLLSFLFQALVLFHLSFPYPSPSFLISSARPQFRLHIIWDGFGSWFREGDSLLQGGGLPSLSVRVGLFYLYGEGFGALLLSGLLLQRVWV